MKHLLGNPKDDELILWLGRVLFWMYMAGLVYFLFFSEHYGRTAANREYHYNLELFKEIKRFWTYRKTLGLETVIVNLIGNVGVFIPLGLAVPLLYQTFRNFLSVLLLGFEISLGAEFIQLMTKVGIFDVDDLVLNTTGCIIGYCVFLWCRSKWRNRT